MRGSFKLVRSRCLIRVASLALLAGSAAGCSTDTMRFTDNPFSSPFERQQTSYTGSIPRQQPAPYQQSSGLGPASSISAQPLPPVGAGDDDGGYAPPQQGYRYNAPQPAGISTSPAVVSNVKGGWNGAGGTTVTANAGDSVHSLSNRYGVPAGAIMSVNGLQGPALSPGQRVIIPVFSTAAEASSPNPLMNVPPRAAPVKQVSINPVRVIPITAAAAKPLKKPSIVLVQGDQPANTGFLPRVVKATPIKNQDSRVETADVTQKPPKSDRLSIAKQVETVPVGQPAAGETTNEAETAQTGSLPTAGAPTQQAARGAPDFRWPVRGRVIQAFGQTNQGINISVPEGTEIKAAESGVVAYAGSELKSLGNLVLIRHSDGFVTAYAHAKDLNVKKGDSIKRGQVIATAGQTGNVTSPQVLFELRKGATPVDPREYLQGN